MMKKEEHFAIWRKALKETLSLNSVLAAAGMAYFAFLSLFPVILLIVAVASRWFDPLWVENELITQLEFIIPGFTQLLGANIARVVQARGSVTATALVLLVWSGSTLFSIVARILDRIWNGRNLRPRIRSRGLALLFVGGFSIVIFPLLFVGTWVTPLLKGLLPDLPLLLYRDMGELFSVLGNILLFGLLYRLLPHAGPRWREVWVGAIPAGILWAIAKRVFVSYTARYLLASNLVYGSVSTIIAFLAWVHISGLILFFGAYLGVEYGEKEKSVPERSVQMDAQTKDKDNK
ncbi:MAG: YihY/virulence factor BrkB family protein [Anaerolineales bacterium]|uniref:YihY/virulence factor BrkB family protein n=1 Tax=Candidatus Desulfolinea nitratireducens TaxID=2841698 RepID=A0A8J6NJ32_9CHLR|nr:YihY/virulence factor BrkB family protein [Candidatus Desulfolinea nitratireducens]MBL6961985.1 YihY/virulence factor BrkB family protein [Anaerolineales bacterium]